MSYNPVNWVNGETPINDTNLNNMDNGIADAHSMLEEHESIINEFVNQQLPEEYVKEAVDTYVENNSAGFATAADLEEVESQLDSVNSEVGELSSEIEEQENFIVNDEYNKTFAFVHGAVSSDGTINNNVKTFIRTDLTTFKTNTVLEVNLLNGYKVQIAKYGSASYDSFLWRTEFLTKNGSYVFEANAYYIICIGYDDVSEIDTNAGDKIIISITNDFLYNAHRIQNEVVVGNSLFEVNSLIQNFVLNGNTGEEEANSTYCVTDFIGVSQYNQIFACGFRNYVLFDENKEFVYAYKTETSDTIPCTIKDGCAYIRFSVRKSKQNDFGVSNMPFSVGDNLGYGINIPNLILPNTINPLSGKSIYGFGDSLMYGHHSGKGILDGLVEKHGMIYTKYAVNGRRIIGTESTSISTDISNASNTVPDFIVFDGLTNDAYEDNVTNHLGALSESNNYSGEYDTTTFYGSAEYICYLLRTKYQNTNIIYIAPHKMPSRSMNAQEVLHNAMKEVCKKWSIPIVSIYEYGQINTCISGMKNDYSYDNAGETSGGNGTHLIGEAYDKYYMPPIVKQMESMI